MEKKYFFKSALGVFGTMCIGELICLLLMFLVFSLAGNNALGLVIAQIIAALMFFGMIYSSVWCIGDEDRNRIKFGKQQKDVYMGLKYGLILMIPSLVMNILLVLEKLRLSFSFFGLYKVLNSHMWPLINMLTATGNDKAPYFIMEITDVSWPVVLVFVSTMLLIPLISAVSYILGLHGLTVKHKIVYKNGK